MSGIYSRLLVAVAAEKLMDEAASTSNGAKDSGFPRRACDQSQPGHETRLNLPSAYSLRLRLCIPHPSASIVKYSLRHELRSNRCAGSRGHDLPTLRLPPSIRRSPSPSVRPAPSLQLHGGNSSSYHRQGRITNGLGRCLSNTKELRLGRHAADGPGILQGQRSTCRTGGSGLPGLAMGAARRGQEV